MGPIEFSTSPRDRIAELNERSRDILRHIVDAYCETGEPVGSRTLSRRLGMNLSPATIRNVMADLEEAGLLFAPHTSAGRVPTDLGLRLFVHGLLEIGDLGEDERRNIEAQCAAVDRGLQQVLEEATSVLSGLSSCAGLVLAPKTDRPLKHMEFVNLAPGRALVVMVNEDGLVENRVVEVPLGLPASTLVSASNYLNARIVGRTLGEAKAEVLAEIERQKTQLDELTAKLVEAGLATHGGKDSDLGGTLIVKGQSRLLSDVTAVKDLERIKSLFDALETKDAMLRLLDAANQAEGVQIFIGAENTLFNHAGCSMIIAPYTDSREQIVGAIGVIGPTRLNYARIIPMVDYTAKVVGRLLWNKKDEHEAA
ncbi:MAG TPA: heat-inducible transcriptional repressor HrcA [Alphaproteobacteria bacterium]|nr:heat-inducible transcriptional repressor HrcA [Alphaproteobacteria bacterium]